jgi:hypothetical protein
MNELVRECEGEVFEGGSQFFAPVSADLVDGLIGRYCRQREKIENFLKMYESADLGGSISYFCRRQGAQFPSFELEDAICALNADFWAEALALTDVYDTMPQKRRDEWNEQMRAWMEPRYKKGKDPKLDLPDFTEDAVRLTLTELLNSRSKFFAERVEGIFRSLSREHVTNCPQGFSKRMILGGVLSYGSPDWKACGHINDLRCVIAKFMGRDEPHHRSSDPVVRAAWRKAGEWMNVDGGALRIRVYAGIGTAHIEVHPDMAWRLNAILASLYPQAIPASFRTRPTGKKKIKDFVLFDRPLPFAVVNMIASMEQAYQWIERNDRRKIRNALTFGFGPHDKAARREAEIVLAAIGGVKVVENKACDYFQFDYDPTRVIDEVACSGCIPDQRSHQFYPTPEKLARIAIELADIQEGHNCLEPSAGIGGLADLMPADTLCIEVSPMHCKVLEAKGKQVVEGDFLKCAARTISPIFDRVVMNPPFSEGRWKAHTEAAAARAVAPGGVLVAILPTSARGTLELPGFDLEWSQIYDNEFAGTSISVVILKATKVAK